jgi:malonyl CoA-acyl carrier protein transacylase/NAD(P)-dependent dehydrogenase (short-subunit alcohol dehydrogenase family)/acyl-CoA thioesterase FadM
MNYFATEYTIHFDDTMAYGSHHFLTAFKLQCAARESFLFGEKIFDVAGVKQALDCIHLLTADAYARNLHAARLGERLAILLTIEEWHRASARFCYRVIRADGQPICAGFQTLIGVDAISGLPIPLPDPLWHAMEAMRAIEEPTTEKSFRERILAGGAEVQKLFGQAQCDAAMGFLRERYPSPHVICSQPISPTTIAANEAPSSARESGTDVELSTTPDNSRQVWVFAGQGALDMGLLCQRVAAYRDHTPASEDELKECARVVKQLIGGEPDGLISGDEAQCRAAIEQTPSLSQVAIHLQNVLGAKTAERRGTHADIVMGHSFGEVAAFEIAGCFDLLTGVKIVCERVRSISEHAPSDGDLLIVSADRSRVASELAFAGTDQVVVAGRNHDQQTVLSGPRDQLSQVADYFRQQDISCVTIPTPTSFHHPRLRKAAQAWSEQIQALPLKAPDRPLYSPNGRRFISSDDDIATTLANQLVRPFDLKGAVDDLMAAGATRFVDCGSTGSLAKLLAKSGAVVSQSTPVQNPVGPSKINGVHNLVASDLTVNRNGHSPPINGHESPIESQLMAESAEVATPIAIVGQGCLLPADANSPEQLYQAIIERRNGIVDQRLFDSDWAEDFYSASLQPDRSTSCLTGLVNDAQIVCPPNVDPDAFARFSRSQRLLCVALAPCIESLRDAKKIMCFVGATADGFEDHDIVTSLRYAGIDPRDAEIDSRLHTRISAGRGPYSSIQELMDAMVRPGIELVMVDAACASSLYAVALGMQALETKRADAVIAGGVFCPGPGNSCLFSQFRGTTSTGCRPFDANADGVVFSEGAAVVTLRRLDDAVRLNCQITGLLRGFGLSSDGRSSSANVPQTRGQLLSLQRCYSNYEIDRSSIDAIEAHGTSTPVGDATELNTLGQFFGKRAKGDIPVHSLKGVLGHAGWAAGTASLIAACQYLQNGVFPGQANFQNPCKALLGCDTSLTVPRNSQPLPSRARLAVDGFGFGGANAHMVVEKYDDSLSIAELSADGPKRQLNGDKIESAPNDDELVIVAYHQLKPEHGNRFDRNHKLSEKHILLPDLADDMDISQGLAVSLADGILAKLPGLNAEVRQATGMILALCGKTERGIEATARILTPRLKRQLNDHAESVEKLGAIMDQSRPSGAYTLQCMMPNVASGRAALQMDLNGPNFVVDGGDHSLEAAFDSASLLLGKRQSHEQLCIVAAIQANGLDDGEAQSEGEFATAFLVATRRSAANFGLKAIQTIDQIRDIWNRSEQGTGAKVRQLMRKLQSAESQNVERSIPAAVDSGSEEKSTVEAPSHTIHTPVWVESQSGKNESEIPAFPSRIAVVLSDSKQADSWIKELSRRGSDFKLILAQSDSSRKPTPSDGSICIVDWNKPQSIQRCLEEVAAFDAEMVICVDSPTSWDLQRAVEVVTDNPVGEWMFLLAQRLESRIRQGKVELWGLFLDSYRDIVHPVTGAAAGVLKSVRRELKTRKGGIAYTSGLTLSRALDRLNQERNEPDNEAEVVFDGNIRRVRRLQAVSSMGTSGANHGLNRDSVVVATGGAQGVTAVLMESILRKYQCTVVAIGRSKPEAGPLDHEDCEGIFYEDYLRQNPNADGAGMKRAYQRARRSWETHATIERLQSLGGHFEYIAADVTRQDEVERAICQVVYHFGDIDLLVHGAGIQLSKQLKDRSLEEFRSTYCVKVGGLRNLVESCHRYLERIPAVHVLTSAYSIFGNDGQHDYGAANETLDRLCELGRTQQHFWSSIAWLAWDGIGMTRGSEYQALAENRGLSMLTPESGAPFLHQVLEGRSNAAINVPISEQECLTYEVETVPGFSGDPGRRMLLSRFDLDEMPWLHHHQVRGVPTVPGAWILNRMVEAAMKVAAKPEGICGVTMEDISFRRFVRPIDYRAASPRVFAIEQADGIEAWVLGDLRHSGGTLLKKDVVLANARFQFQYRMNGNPVLGHMPVDSGADNFLSDPYCSQNNGQVGLSGPFDCLDKIQIHSEGRQARFALPADCDATGPTVTPALLLDATWRVGAMYAQPNNTDLYVPVHIKRITMPVDADGTGRHLTDCIIRSARPEVDQDCAYWSRSEVRDCDGRLQIVVEHAQAKKMG